MIKIAYVIDTIETPSAGTEQQLLMLLNNLDRKRFLPFLICLKDSPWLKSQSFDFPIIILNLPKIISLNLIKFIRQFRAFHKKEKFDIVQTFFFDAAIAGTIAAKLAGCKVILSSRRNSLDRISKAQRLLFRFLQKYIKAYIANSERVARSCAQIEKARPEKYHIIYNGMYLERFRLIGDRMRFNQRTEWGIAENEILIGVTANLRKVKNIDSLIRAAADLTKKYDNLKFVVVGEGPQREYLQNLIESLELTGKFKLGGKKADIIPCIMSFDIGVLCSKAEGFSNSLIEYMAAGLPVAASDVGGNAEAISHKENGLIFPLNEFNGLTDSLSYLIENKAIAREFGIKAKAAAMKKYDVKTYVKNHEEFYTNILSGDNFISDFGKQSQLTRN